MANNTFRALAHPIRRRVVERLALGSATVGETTRGFGVSKPTLTRHLRVLEEAGIVVREVEGRTHRLRLDASPLNEASAWLETQRARWERLYDVVEQYLDEQPRKGPT
jgi:DNA-binding transcriptional ArsR family regulator